MERFSIHELGQDRVYRGCLTIAALPVAAFLCLVATMFDHETLHKGGERLEFGWPLNWIAQSGMSALYTVPYPTNLQNSRETPSDILALGFLIDAIFWCALTLVLAYGCVRITPYHRP